MKLTQTDKWLDFSYNVNSVVTHFNIGVALQQFWNEIMFEIDIKQFVLIQFKVLLTNGTYSSISYVQTTNYKNKDELYETFIEFWNICNEEYPQTPVDKIVFTYKILNELNSKIRKSKIIKIKY
uniref:hypothetical protein n=1 Tax=Porodaedalea chrysoloma TaxID=74615 RepID=UPI0023AB1FE0|nr:hypothetical protein P1S03_mgp06 [Porodaedalea chrysoloma]WCF76800.1 hypothetical protein [Porodaedalea chrysoloma]